MPQRPATPPLHLPLTAPCPVHPSLARGVTPEAIGRVVQSFYAECRRHPVLGPIFIKRVHDWDAHLARITSFWCAAALGTGEYAGRPIEAHIAIPGLSRDHFSIWLRLFMKAVAEHCEPDDAAAIMALAGRMANRLMAAANEQPAMDNAGE